MTAFRRHLIVLAWTVLSVYALGVGRATADACADHEHTHGGVAAPDCAMHHQPGGSSHTPADHSHHGDHLSHGAPSGAQMSCHCGGDLQDMYVSPPAVVQPPMSHAPAMLSATLDAPADVALIPLRSSPPSPPPR